MTVEINLKGMTFIVDGEDCGTLRDLASTVRQDAGAGDPATLEITLAKLEQVSNFLTDGFLQSYQRRPDTLPIEERATLVAAERLAAEAFAELAEQTFFELGAAQAGTSVEEFRAARADRLLRLRDNDDIRAAEKRRRSPAAGTRNPT